MLLERRQRNAMESNVAVSSIQIGRDMVIEIMRTLWIIIIGGILEHNRLFVPPEEFLNELCERRGKRPSAAV
jgi:hypothetical protein